MSLMMTNHLILFRLRHQIMRRWKKQDRITSLRNISLTQDSSTYREELSWAYCLQSIVGRKPSQKASVRKLSPKIVLSCLVDYKQVNNVYELFDIFSSHMIDHVQVGIKFFRFLNPRVFHNRLKMIFFMSTNWLKLMWANNLGW